MKEHWPLAATVKNVRPVRTRNKTFVLCALWVICLVCLTSITKASAIDIPDETRKGTICATMAYGGQKVGGGQVTIYKVGDLIQNNGEYSFALTDEFKDSGVSLDEASDPTLAKVLAEYLGSTQITGSTVQIDKNGFWFTDDLELGVYLVEQSKAATGYLPFSPFLVTLPLFDENSGTYIYDVNAEPKLEIYQEVTTFLPPDTVVPKDPILPQTGQLNWPIPVLSVLGALLIGVGCGERIIQRQRHKYCPA